MRYPHIPGAARSFGESHCSLLPAFPPSLFPPSSASGALSPLTLPAHPAAQSHNRSNLCGYEQRGTILLGPRTWRYLTLRHFHQFRNLGEAYDLPGRHNKQRGTGRPLCQPHQPTMRSHVPSNTTSDNASFTASIKKVDSYLPTTPALLFQSGLRIFSQKTHRSVPRSDAKRPRLEGSGGRGPSPPRGDCENTGQFCIDWPSQLNRIVLCSSFGVVSMQLRFLGL